MKDRKELKLLLSVMVVIGTVFSLGCLSAADEIDEEDMIPDQTVTETDDEDLVIGEVEEVVSVEADNVVSDGWSQSPSNGWWYYYVGGKYVTGWKEIGGLWYCFESNGKMITGLYFDESLNDYFLFAIDGHMLTGWQRYDLDWLYFGPTGRAAKGWTHIDGKWYFFNETNVPYMHTYFFEYKNNMYFFGGDGVMRTGWVNWENEWFYFDPATGIGARGWKQFGDKYYYFDEQSYIPLMLSNGIFNLGAGWYGFNSDGTMITGWYNDDVIKVNGKDYNNGNWYYFKSTGSAAVGWTKVGNNWYYFENKSGYKPTAYQGLRTINSAWYYFNIDNCAMITNSWVNLTKSQKTIYYGSKNDYWAYFDGNGAAVSGWQKIDNKTYFFIKDSYVPYMHTGFLYYDDGRYYMGNNGVMRTGWFMYQNDYCYADSKGLMMEDGWLELGGKTYYFRWGKMVTGLMEIGGKLYDFGTNGVCRNPAVG